MAAKMGRRRRGLPAASTAICCHRGQEVRGKEEGGEEKRGVKAGRRRRQVVAGGKLAAARCREGGRGGDRGDRA